LVVVVSTYYQALHDSFQVHEENGTLRQHLTTLSTALEKTEQLGKLQQKESAAHLKAALAQNAQQEALLAQAVASMQTATASEQAARAHAAACEKQFHEAMGVVKKASAQFKDLEAVSTELKDARNKILKLSSEKNAITTQCVTLQGLCRRLQAERTAAFSKLQQFTRSARGTEPEQGRAADGVEGKEGSGEGEGEEGVAGVREGEGVRKGEGIAGAGEGEGVAGAGEGGGVAGAGEGEGVAGVVGNGQDGGGAD
jgi:hypothetical protein